MNSKIHVHFLAFFLLVSLSLQAQSSITSTHTINEPAILANKIYINYGVKPQIVLELLNVYENEDLSFQERANKVENLIEQFTNLPLHTIEDARLGQATLQTLGIQQQPQIKNILEWHIYTSGPNSPAILAHGNVEIWYGIPQEVLRQIVKLLEADKKLNIEEKNNQLIKEVGHFKRIQKALLKLPKNDFRNHLEQTLEEGNIEQIEIVLSSKQTISRAETAFIAYSIAIMSERNSNFKRAEKNFREAVYLFPNDFEYQLGWSTFLTVINEHKKANKNLHELVKRTIKFQGKEQKNLAICYVYLAESYRGLSSFKKANESINKAFAVMNNLHDFSQKEKTRALLLASEINRQLSQFQVADSLLSEAQILFKQSQDNEGLADCYYLKSQINQKQKKAQETIELLSLALEKRNEAYGENHWKTGNALGNLGVAYLSLNQYKKAKEFLEKSLAIRERYFDKNHEYVLTSNSNLATCNFQLGNFKDAIKNYEALLENALVDSANVAINIAYLKMNLGVFHIQILDMNKAEALLFRAKDDFKKIYENGSNEEVGIELSLGVLYRELGDLPKAHTAVDNAFKIIQKLSPKPNISWAQYYHRKANIWIEEEKFQEAFEVLEKATGLFAAHNNLKNMELALANVDLAKVKAVLGQTEGLLDFNKNICDSLLQFETSIKDVGLANTYINIAKLYETQDSLSQARSYFQKAYDIKIKKFGSENKHVIAVQKSLDQINSKTSISYNKWLIPLVLLILSLGFFLWRKNSSRQVVS